MKTYALILCGLIASASLAQAPATDRAGAATTPAATAANGRWWETEPGWSNEVAGLKVQLTGGKYLTPRMGLEVSVRFWNTSGTTLAIAPGDPTCFNWELRDAQDHAVAPEKPSVDAPPASVWMYLSRDQSGTGRILGQSSENRDGVLHVGNQRWKLTPGTYALHGSFSDSSTAEGQKAGERWRGKIDLVPLNFTVLAAITPEVLKVAAAKIQAMPFADLGQRYTALAALIEPGMTYSDLKTVLPPMAAKNGAMEISMWNGNFFMGRYPLDGGYTVEAVGFGDTTGKSDIILSSSPKIIPPPAANTQPK